MRIILFINICFTVGGGLTMFEREIIEKVVYDTVPADLIEQVIVFGSRARNEETKDSDTDICIIFKDELPREDISRYRIALNEKFAFDYLMPTDIIMKSAYTYNRYKGVVGGIEYEIAKYGVRL